MQNVFINCYFCGILKYLQENCDCEAEKELNSLGKDIGRRLSLLFDFKIENDINSLIYRIVFEFLPNLYEADRKIEKMEDNEDSILFLIYEKQPLITSVTFEEKDFCPASLFSGIIESILNILNENLKVFAYNKPSNEYPAQVVYIIKAM